MTTPDWDPKTVLQTLNRMPHNLEWKLRLIFHHTLTERAEEAYSKLSMVARIAAVLRYGNRCDKAVCWFLEQRPKEADGVLQEALKKILISEIP